MKKLILSKLLALALILNPMAALAQDTGRVNIVDAARTGSAPSISDSMTPEQLEKVVNDVVYSIDNIENALVDIEKLAGGPNGNQPTPAAGGLSKAVVAKLGERFRAAVELLAALQLDTKLDDKVRDSYVDKVNGRVGALFFKVLRFHGEDELTLEKDFRSSPELKPGMNAFQIALARTKFYMRRVFKEFALDVKTLVTFKRAAIDARIGGRQAPAIVWGPVDRVRRNQLMGQIIPHLNQYAVEILPRVESQADRLGAGRDFWVEKVVTKSIGIRNERITGQKAATATYFGLSAIGFFAPLIDIVGVANGFERTDLTLDYSAQMYFTIWLTAGFMKAATFISKGTKTTIKALEGLLEHLKSVPEGAIAKNATLPERLKKISGEVTAEKAAELQRAGLTRVVRGGEIRTEKPKDDQAPSAGVRGGTCPAIFLGL